MKRARPIAVKTVNKKAIILNSIFFIAAAVNLLNLWLFDGTIMHWKVVAAIYLLSGILYFPLHHFLKSGTSYGNFSCILFCIITGGSLITATFLGLNYLLKESSGSSEQLTIVRKSSIPGSRNNRSNRKPTFYVKVDGILKRFDFRPDRTEDVEKADSVDLYLSEGFLGYDIVDSIRLK
ncbi:hypothetical protein [Pedobacter sp. SYSU D00535]|uniref:hypothetical protein n=1 Tax=Pedobacter sp. SYSU D00535 TaxID=2810308 RepID=UPI001A96DB6A|nr:hypothetical protein [Pedobacter sp. SYSU D00535]